MNPILVRVNLLPKTDSEVEEFRRLMEPILEFFQNLVRVLMEPGDNDFSDPFASSDPHQSDKFKWMTEEFRKRIEKEIPKKCQGLALHISTTSVRGMEIKINDLKAERESLLSLIAAVDAKVRGEYRSPDLYRRSHVWINDDFTVSEREKGALSAILDERIPIDRIRECPECRDIFWMKIVRVKSRVTKTCGGTNCVTKNQRKKEKNNGTL